MGITVVPAVSNPAGHRADLDNPTFGVFRESLNHFSSATVRQAQARTLFSQQELHVQEKAKRLCCVGNLIDTSHA